MCPSLRADSLKVATGQVPESPAPHELAAWIHFGTDPPVVSVCPWPPRLNGLGLEELRLRARHTARENAGLARGRHGTNAAGARCVGTSASRHTCGGEHVRIAFRPAHRSAMLVPVDKESGITGPQGRWSSVRVCGLRTGRSCTRRAGPSRARQQWSHMVSRNEASCIRSRRGRLSRCSYAALTVRSRPQTATARKWNLLPPPGKGWRGCHLPCLFSPRDISVERPLLTA